MSTRAWIIFVAICVAAFAGRVVISGRDKVDVSNIDASALQPAAANNGMIADHVYGNKDAKVVLIMYGDFQCPGCGNVHPFVKNLSEKYKDQMAFVFRNFPLTNLHPNARAAAAAAEAAGKLGKYWEMNNTLYENQSPWSEASAGQRGSLFAGYAAQIGLDKSKFTSVLTKQSASINKKINFDMALGRKLNVTGTPTFYLDGKKLDENQYNGQDGLEKTLLAEFKKQGVTITETSETQ
jgi:protein-disulfide isomerase